MIKVLQVGLSKIPGGVENFVLNYHMNIDREEIIFDYLDIYGEGLAFTDKIQELSGKVWTCPCYKKYPFKFIKYFEYILRNNSYDIVHYHMQSTANLLPIIVSLKCNTKLITHSHSSSTPKGNLRRVLDFINKPIVRNIVSEQWACGFMSGNWMWGKGFDSSHIIKNAIDYDRFKYNSYTRALKQKELGLNINNKIIGFVGRFGWEKNTFFLLKVLKELLNYDKNYKLIVIGGSDLYDEFVERLEKESLSNNCILLGFRKDVETWYQLMDAFLLPSFFEGLPLVGIEAQASGLPCFFSDRISKEIDINRKNHFLPINTNDDAKIWAKEIEIELQNNQRYKKIFPDEYRIKNAAKKLENIYKNILNNR